MKKFRFYFLWLAGICIIMFIFQQFSGFTELFILNQKALDGEYWRFLTSIFLHGDLIHLLYNLFALLFFGLVLEKLISSNRFLLIFLGSGILANIISVNFYTSSLGASGAIYGILGCLAIIRPMMMVWAFGLIMPLFAAAGLWIIADMLRTIGFFGETNIGSIAHLSGIAIGIFIGLIIKLTESKVFKKNKKIKIPDSYIDAWEEKYMQ
jgi:hypothetical protein